MSEEKSPANIIIPRIVLNLPKVGLPDILLSENDSPVEGVLVADLFVFYAFDEPTRFTMVAYRDLLRLGWTKHPFMKLH